MASLLRALRQRDRIFALLCSALGELRQQQTQHSGSNKKRRRGNLQVIEKDHPGMDVYIRFIEERAGRIIMTHK
ncbi:hypothetical protein [Pantoea anthophila]|uniref:hypothetical protein n=1 Tax=Pantoea anthophila TaxID=470931 RepID=UPI0027813406|nr:hypothetical protein [Pantoea anthophila]MDQ1213131.1 hypothetical protein [Pantoea anthophila]